MKLNKEQTIKILEWCIQNDCNEECFGFEMYGTSECRRILAENALAVIKELTKENENLRADTVYKVIESIKTKGRRDAYACMISGENRESYTIQASELNQIKKEILEKN